MKAIKFLILNVALIVGLATASAQDNLTVVLKDGSELTGYFSQQRPGENFTFRTSKAIIVLPNNEVSSILDSNVKVKNLSPEWQAWAETNDAYEGSGNDRTLRLSNIVTKQNTVNHVRLLEKGAKVRYLDLSPNSYTLTWDTIQVVRAEKRPKLLLSGINRVYKLSSGMEYEGQYIEETPGETMSLMGYSGVIEVFNTEDVVKDTRIKINPNQTLLEQSDLIDIVKTRNGATYKGVIFERNYSGNDSISNYLLIQQEDGNIKSLLLSDVTEYLKERNSKYNPVTDIILEENEVAINRIVTTMRPTKDISGVVTVNIDSISTNLPISNPQIITAEFSMDNSKAQQPKLVRIRKFQDKKGKSTHYGFTYEDMVKYALQPKSVETSVNGISKLEYNLLNGEQGTYGIYDPLTNRILIFTISGQPAIG